MFLTQRWETDNKFRTESLNIYANKKRSRVKITDISIYPYSYIFISLYYYLRQWFSTPSTPEGDQLKLSENNIGNGGEHKRKGVKIKTQKQSYKVLIYKEKLMLLSFDLILR